MTAPPRQVISVAVQWDPAPIPAGKTATRYTAGFTLYMVTIIEIYNVKPAV
jgi:hypothetical protein